MALMAPHAVGCRSSACPGCWRAGDGHGIDSPSHAAALEDLRVAHCARLEVENRELRGKVARLERRNSDLELRLRGVPRGDVH